MKKVTFIRSDLFLLKDRNLLDINQIYIYNICRVSVFIVMVYYFGRDM